MPLTLLSVIRVFRVFLVSAAAGAVAAQSRVDIPLMFDSGGRYVIPVSMVSDWRICTNRLQALSTACPRSLQGSQSKYSTSRSLRLQDCPILLAKALMGFPGVWICMGRLSSY